MVWHGMVWQDILWHGMVWHCMASHCMVWHGMIWSCKAWSDIAWGCNAWYGVAWPGMVWYGMIWEGHTMPCHNNTYFLSHPGSHPPPGNLEEAALRGERKTVQKTKKSREGHRTRTNVSRHDISTNEPKRGSLEIAQER